MAEMLRVALRLTIAREDSDMQEYAAIGEWRRLPTGSGWRLACRLPELDTGTAMRDGGAATPDNTRPDHNLTLIIRPDEIRMKRTGQVTQEQRFRIGQWLTGTIGTAYGDLRAEALTRRLEMDLTSDGGAVEWEYELRTAELELGRTAVTLHIQEAPSV